MSQDLALIRNICIIAHIDHGKSTLADRLLELTGTIAPRQMRAQVLDSMDLERERGITIKLQPVRMNWRGYNINLIDTPGHVDFTYEVSRSLAAVEGALLVVDGSQGIQAQTLANTYLARAASLKIIPIVNKIDLVAADAEGVARELAKLIGTKAEKVIKVSAKTGAGVDKILQAVIDQVPPPTGSSDGALRGLVFDSAYDEYRGVILYVRVVDGKLTAADKISLLGSGAAGEALEVGWLTPTRTRAKELSSGEIGYVVTNLKTLDQAQVGDTLTSQRQPATRPLPGYQAVKPYVFASFFPISNEDHTLLKESLAKLKLNDAALQFSPESSPVLGFGFRIGFLGLLHLEIIKERLEREFGLELIVTNPSTDYEILKTDGMVEVIQSVNQLPDRSKLAEIREPWITGEAIAPQQYVGQVVQLINEIRGYQSNIAYPDERVAMISFEAPLAKIITNFYDRLKSLTSGYGSFSYDIAGYRVEDLVRLDILIAGEVLESLSQIIHKGEAVSMGRLVLGKLKEVIPRQQFEVSLQAAIGGKIIAREDVKALGKNVTANLYGGDVTRKRKLWAKQKAGKARLKKIGKIELPSEAFSALLRKD